ncbi:leucine-rich repeat protein [uncultured Rikenella sp.]|uniref:leucine-rich repeat protein n=1 Tax=uncultured Rikenella sp. TaxID=368003 RepID=UPI0025F80C91|nr:leucine-rich repeat protein [uncultured Rikenella sp.]
MKRLFPIWALLALLLAGGCSKNDGYFNGEEPEPEPKPDDELTEQVEQLCKQANMNIASLQALVAAMQEGDYVKAVIPIMQEVKEKSKDKEIGHTITFENRDSITIFHGTESDTTGNGTMPVIGLRMDEDSVYYWTLNGTWLLEKGNKVQIRSTLPQLKLQSGYWYLSNDRQQAGQQFGKATDADCDKTFQGVTQDDYNVYILLASGEKITLRKMSELVVQITEKDTLLRFSDNETQTIHYTITGDTVNLEVKAEMQNDDGGYTLQITPTSKTAGTVEIQAKTPTENHVIISVSDGRQTVQTSIAVSPYPPFDGQTIRVIAPGTLKQSLVNHDQSTLTELRVVGSINDEDIATLKALPNLSVLDIEDTDLIKLPSAAFKNNKTLTSIKLPQSLTEIENSAFYGCSGLTGDLTIPEGVTTIGESAFDFCYGFTEVVIPEGVTTIEKYAFRFCSGLTGNLTIPNSLTEIKEGVFAYCNGLTDVTIPNSVTIIGPGAFMDCTGLAGPLTIPNSVTRIGYEAFGRCSGLTGNLIIPDGVTTIESRAFDRCSGFTGTLKIPEGVTEIGSSAFSGCSGFTGNLVIPERVTEIGEFAFVGCSGLTGNLTIPSSVKTIGAGAFQECSGLTSVTIPNSVTTIERSAFQRCTGLTSVTIPNSVTEIGSSAFQGCTGLTSVTIPNSVTTIERSAFQSCTGLTSVTIPESVTTIGERAFYGCSGLTTIYCKPNTPPSVWDDNTFGTTSNCVLYVPTGCAEAYRNYTVNTLKAFPFKNIIETNF